MLDLTQIRQEHEAIKHLLSRIDFLIKNKDRQREVVVLLKSFIRLWDGHEEKEEIAFSHIKQHSRKEFPEEMLVEQHKQLRGHWKIINDSIKSNDPLNIEITLDTDGQMLISKLLKHIDYEEKLLDEL